MLFQLFFNGGDKVFAGFLIGAVSVIVIFSMFEVMAGVDEPSDKWCQIFGISMVWLAAIGIIFCFVFPAETSEVVSYSAASIK